MTGEIAVANVRAGQNTKSPSSQPNLSFMAAMAIRLALDPEFVATPWVLLKRAFQASSNWVTY
jgi:hypothetical protein